MADKKKKLTAICFISLVGNIMVYFGLLHFYDHLPIWGFVIWIYVPALVVDIATFFCCSRRGVLLYNGFITSVSFIVFALVIDLKGTFSYYIESVTKTSMDYSISLYEKLFTWRQIGFEILLVSSALYAVWKISEMKLFLKEEASTDAEQDVFV